MGSARKRIGVAACALAVALLLRVPAAHSRATPVRVSYPSLSGTQGPVWVAIEAGIFAKHGLAVDFVLIRSGTTGVQALIGGDTQFAAIAGPAVVQARLGGADLLWIATMTNKLVFSVMARPDITRPGDLRGRKMGITRFGSASDFAGQVVLRAWGLQPGKDVTLVQMGGISEILGGLKSRTVDAGVVSVPTNRMAVSQGFHELFNIATLPQEFAFSGVATTRHRATAERALVTAFLKGFVEGIARFKQDRELSVKVLARHLRTNDPKLLVDTWQTYASAEVTERVPIPTEGGIAAVLEGIAASDERARRVRARELIAPEFIRELAQSGFISSLYARSP